MLISINEMINNDEISIKCLTSYSEVLLRLWTYVCMYLYKANSFWLKWMLCDRSYRRFISLFRWNRAIPACWKLWSFAKTSDHVHWNRCVNYKHILMTKIHRIILYRLWYLRAKNFGWNKKTLLQFKPLFTILSICHASPINGYGWTWLNLKQNPSIKTYF